MKIKIEKYDVTPQKIVVGTEGSYGVEILEFDFSTEWDECTKTVSFYPSSGEPVVSVVHNGKVEVPSEFTADKGTGKIVVEGVKDGVCILSVILYATILETLAPATTPPSSPTPTEMQQVLTYLSEAESLANSAKTIADSVRQDADEGKFDGEKGERGERGFAGEDGIDARQLVEGNIADLEGLISDLEPKSTTWYWHFVDYDGSHDAGTEYHGATLEDYGIYFVVINASSEIEGSITWFGSIRGLKGDRGEGISNITSEQKDGYTLVTFTYADGTTATAELPNGQDGINGYSCTITKDDDTPNQHTLIIKTTPPEGSPSFEYVTIFDGVDGRDGINGTNGINGVSAYAINGNGGFSAWLTECLNGKTGDNYYYFSIYMRDDARTLTATIDGYSYSIYCTKGDVIRFHPYNKALDVAYNTMGGTSDVVWGDIGGDISNQADLMEMASAIGTIIDSKMEYCELTYNSGSNTIYRKTDESHTPLTFSEIGALIQNTTLFVFANHNGRLFVPTVESNVIYFDSSNIGTDGLHSYRISIKADETIAYKEETSQTKLTSNQMNAVNSGITALHKMQYDTYATSKANASDVYTKSEIDAKIGTIESRLSEV